MLGASRARGIHYVGIISVNVTISDAQFIIDSSTCIIAGRRRFTLLCASRAIQHTPQFTRMIVSKRHSSNYTSLIIDGGIFGMDGGIPLSSMPILSKAPWIRRE